MKRGQAGGDFLDRRTLPQMLRNPERRVVDDKPPRLEGVEKDVVTSPIWRSNRFAGVYLP